MLTTAVTRPIEAMEFHEADASITYEVGEWHSNIIDPYAITYRHLHEGVFVQEWTFSRTLLEQILDIEPRGETVGEGLVRGTVVVNELDEKLVDLSFGDTDSPSLMLDIDHAQLSDFLAESKKMVSDEVSQLLVSSALDGVLEMFSQSDET